MAKERDPAEIVATLRRSIEASQRGSRRVRAHRFRELFGFSAWSAARREMVGRLLADEGIVVQPALEEAGRDDWLILSMPTLPQLPEAHLEPAPSAEWFAYLEQVQLGSEREVEMHFVSPLFEKLGYKQEQEAAGFGFVLWEGVRQHNVEADLLYFVGDVHDTEHGEPLVLVECKALGKGPDAGLGQVRSYAFWLKPAYYVLTDGDYVTVWNYQGGAVPDVRVIEVRRGELREKFDELYAVLNPEAVLKARREKSERLTARPGT
ncbi:MAG: type I restriction enzyme HsdR N-terminal domain-containing protein [Streptosporangiaceae bacterium]